MRTYPETDLDYQDLLELEAPRWMLEQLKLNPEYSGWAPGDDCMAVSGDGWNASMTFASWKEFSLELNDLNEIVNFYFDLTRPSKDCASCEHSGYNQATKALWDSFYDHSSKKGEGWNDKLTQDEVDMLAKDGRFRNSSTPITAAVVNAAQGRLGIRNLLLTHDGINRYLLTEHRAKRLGVFGICSSCDGKGHHFTGPARLDLVLWILHPRKGASRGATIQNLQKSELTKVYVYLEEAAKRNAARFAPVTAKVLRSKL